MEVILNFETVKPQVSRQRKKQTLFKKKRTIGRSIFYVYLSKTRVETRTRVPGAYNLQEYRFVNIPSKKKCVAQKRGYVGPVSVRKNTEDMRDSPPYLRF